METVNVDSKLLKQLYSKMELLEKEVKAIRGLLEDNAMSQEDLKDLDEALEAHKKGKTKNVSQMK